MSQTRGSGITGERFVRADACVIGTGAGGAPVAKELAEGGLRVVMLEEGERFTPDDMTARPGEMTTRLYRDAGQTTTIGNVPIGLPLGQAVGGTTVVNSGTCFRTPPAVLARWRERHGLEELTPAALDPFFRRVERELHVAQVTPELAGRNAAVVKRGADALGWHGDYHLSQRQGLRRLGSVRLRLPDRGQAARRTGVRAEGLGRGRLHLQRLPRPAHPARAAGRARGVEAATAGGGLLRVECGLVVVACGAMHTPLLLRRNGLGRDSGELGRNLAIHPATAVRALFDEQIDMARGVPQSFYIDEFADEGIMFEGAAGPPDYLAMGLRLLARAPPRADAELPQPVSVRRDGLRRLARLRARARRAAGDPLRPRATRTCAGCSGAASSCWPSSTGPPGRGRSPAARRALPDGRAAVRRCERTT